MAPLAAQPAASAQTITAAAARRSDRRSGPAGSEDIDTTRNLEREVLIGQADVFLQISERKARLSTLAVHRDQPSDRQGRRVDDQHQPIVVPLAGFGYKFQ